MAHPRQTDLLAKRVSEQYLMECKWRSDKANIDDLDSLRSRLNRTSPSVVGVLVSMNGFTEPVLSEVQRKRAQPVLLISGDELGFAAAGLSQSLPSLL